MARHRRARPWWLPYVLLGAVAAAVLAAAWVAVARSSAPHSAPPRPPAYHAAVPGKPPVLPPERRPGRVHREVRRYAVRPGDTLWGIASRYCGDPLDWHALYAANRHVIGPDADAIAPGQRYVLACAYHPGRKGARHDRN